MADELEQQSPPSQPQAAVLYGAPASHQPLPMRERSEGRASLFEHDVATGGNGGEGGDAMEGGGSGAATPPQRRGAVVAAPFMTVGVPPMTPLATKAARSIRIDIHTTPNWMDDLSGGISWHWAKNCRGAED